ncbi:MAG: tripartite tricarboxylate transporter substrate-binding protein [Rhodothermales bacterium]
MRSLSTLLLVLLLGFFSGGCQTDDAFPNRPITMIVPWSVGGGTDRVARQIAAQLEQELGVPVNVVNASGGAGVTGHTRGALAEPNGYTMTMITAELNMLHWRGLTNITHRDFRPLMRVNRDYAALFVRADSPWETIDELEAEVRDRPGELRASGTAFGGIWHVALAGWLIRNDLSAGDIVWLSLNGSAPSLQEMMAGGVDVVSCSVPEAQSLVDAGEIRCLTVMAEERLPSVPDVPTLEETGVDWTSFTWRGLALPLGVPEDRVEVLESAVRNVVTSDEYLAFSERAGFGAAADGPEAFAEALEEENRAFGEIFQSAAFESVRRQTYGPWLFPAAIGVLMSVSLVLSVLAHVRRDTSEDRERDDVTRRGILFAAGAIGAVLLYVLVVESLGYVVTAACILLGFFLLLRVRLPVALAASVASAVVTYHLFAVLLRVPLPWGVLGW